MSYFTPIPSALPTIHGHISSHRADISQVEERLQGCHLTPFYELSSKQHVTEESLSAMLEIVKSVLRAALNSEDDVTQPGTIMRDERNVESLQIQDPRT